MQKKAVVRVLTQWPGGKSKHVTVALNAFLARPMPLPPDPGPGPYPVVARLSLAEVGRGMALAREPHRAAFVRRVCLWRFFARRDPASTSRQSVSARPAQPQPVAPVSTFAPPSSVCLSRCGNAPVFDLLLPIAHNTLIAHGAGHLFDPTDRYEMWDGFL